MKNTMKKYALPVLAVLICTWLGVLAQAQNPQVPRIPKDPQIPKLPVPERLVFGSLKADPSIKLEALAASYQCSDITVKVGEDTKAGFKVVQSGKVLGNIKDGKCAYSVPYDSKIPSKQYVMRFEAPRVFSYSGCSNYGQITIPDQKVVYLPTATGPAPRVDVTFTLFCKQIG